MMNKTPLTACADWKTMYQPSAEQAEIDRQAAYEAGIPHGESCKDKASA